MAATAETLIDTSQGLPDAEDVRNALLHGHLGYDPLSGDYEQWVRQIDQVAPVQAHFIPTVTPDGGPAPEHIRQQWVGLSLPVRSKSNLEEDGKEAFVVRAREAQEIFKSQRPEAYEWWRAHYIKERAEVNEAAIVQYNANREDPWRPYRNDDPYPENPDFPEWGVNGTWFRFFPEWGMLVPVPEFSESLARDSLVQVAGQLTVQHTALVFPNSSGSSSAHENHGDQAAG